MDLSNLKPAEGSTSTKKRLGRGQGSGWGGTSTRGHKGAKARSGYSHKLGFEGGQMPYIRRVPKFGFNNINRVEYRVINLSDLEDLASKLNVSDINRVKVLGNGKLSKKINVTAHAFSKSAKEAIESLSGTANTL